MNDNVSAFVDNMRHQGVGPSDPSTIICDDTVRRYHVEGDKPNTINGAYCVKFEANGFGVGWFISHKDGVNHSWHSKATRGISPDERDAHKKSVDDAKKKRDIAIKKSQTDAATRAIETWGKCDRTGTTGYLDRKNIVLNGARIHKGMVAVPMYKNAKMVGIQFIKDDGEKVFMKGVEKAGAYHSIRGQDMSVIRICEGYATGGAIRMVFPDNPVIVAFDSGNLKPVTKAMAKKYPSSQIIICADNDQWRKKQNGDLENIGMIKAGQAAVSIGGASVKSPPFSSDDPGHHTDWQDYLEIFGLERTRAAMLVEPKPEPEQVETPLDGIVSDDCDPAVDSKLDSIRPLGHNKGIYYFFPRSAGQIIDLSAGSMSKLTNLYQLAPHYFWETHYDVDGKGSSSAIAGAAANHLISTCHDIGVFQMDNTRGVGVWIDDGGVVVNTGQKIIGDGINVAPSEFKGAKVYESGARVINMGSDELSKSDATELLGICKSLTWKRPQYSTLLAGWIVVAGIGGCLGWRPHIWLTGPSGSGKSTVMDKIIKRCMNDIAVILDGGTTEAAVRKYLGVSSRPFIMDEAESESVRDRVTMDAIIGLFRKASSGGVIANANSSFNAMSCACFAAINPNVKEVADQARITLIELEKDKSPDRKSKYDDILKRIHGLITPCFHDRLFKLSFSHADILLSNIETFKAAATILFGNSRTADQLAPMIAGAYLLTDRGIIDIESAKAWLQNDDWDWFTSIADDTDSGKIVAHIMTSRISYDSMGMRREGTIGDLIEHVIGGVDGYSDIHKGLRAYGVKVENDFIHIANNSKNMASLLRDTPWVPWARTLGDYPGSSNNGNKPVYFMAGVTSKVTSIPIDALREVVEPVEEELHIYEEGDFS